jgi:hypothetical protein
MADKKSKFISGQKETPDLEIQRTPEGKFIINYAASDPMGLMSPMAGKDLDSVIQSFFGYSGWDEYKRENKKDLTRKVDSETGAAPTVHPFHVAYAFLEFFNNFKAEDYVVVGYPIKPTVQELEPDFEGPIQSEEEYEEDEERKGKEAEEQARTDARVKSKSEETTLTTSAEQARKDAETAVPKGPARNPEDAAEDARKRGIKRGRGPIKLDEITGAGGASEEAALTGLEVTAGQPGPADEEEARSLTKLQRQVKKKAADEMELLKAKKKIESIINKRRAFFGTSVVADLGDPQRGVFNNALYAPAEKLENTDAIDRVKQRFNFAAKYQALLMQEFPVQHPNGLYWKNMPKNIDDIVGEPGNALIISFGQDKIKQSVLLRETARENLEAITPSMEVQTGLVFLYGAAKTAAVTAMAIVKTKAYAAAILAGAGPAAAKAAAAAASSTFAAWVGGAASYLGWALVIAAGGIAVGYLADLLVRMYFESTPTPLVEFTQKFSHLPQAEQPKIFRSKQEKNAWLKAEGRRLAPDGPANMDVDLSDVGGNISDVYNESNWEKRVNDKKIELKRKALDRKVKRIEQGAQTPEERETEPADRAEKGYLRGDITLIYELLPKGWRDGKWLTDAEDVLARRVAANRNVTPEVVFDSERRTLEEIPPILNTYVPGDGLDPNVADQLERITKGKRYAIEQKEKASYILRSNKARMPSWFEEYYKAVNETHPYFVENYDPPEALGRWATPDNPYSPTELYKLWKTQNHPAVFLINELRAQKIIDDEVWKEARIALVGKAVGAGWEDASSILEDAGVNPQSEEYMKAREASRTEARITPATDAIEAWRSGTENAYGGIDWPGGDASPPMKEGWSDGVEAWEDKDAETWWSEDHDKLKKFEDPTFQQRRLKIKEMEERYEEASASENPSDEQQEVIDSLHAQQRKLKVARGGVENEDGQIVAPPGGYTEWKKMGAYARTEYLQTLGIPVPENVGRFSTSETEEMDLEPMDTGPRDKEPSVLNLEPMDTGPRDEEESADLDLAKPDAPGAGDYKKSRAERAKAAMARSRVGAREKEVQEFPDAGAIGTPEEEDEADVRELPDQGRIGTPEEEDEADVRELPDQGRIGTPEEEDEAEAPAGGGVPYAFIQDNLGIGKSTWDTYRNTIGQIESANKYGISGGAGDLYDGRYQIGAAAKAGGARHARKGGIDIPDWLPSYTVKGEPYPGHEPEKRQMFRDSPELQEKIFAGLTVANHKSLSKSSKYQNLSKFERLEILGYGHNQGASDVDPIHLVTLSTPESISKFGGKKKRKKIRSSEKRFLKTIKPYDPGATISEKPVSVSAFRWLESDKKLVGQDAFGTRGTKYSNALKKAYDPQAQGVDDLEKIRPAELKEIRALIFGHSQTGRLSKAFKKEIAEAGGVTPKIKKDGVFGGYNDDLLYDEIKNIEPDNFTHAYLFLNGNPGTSKYDAGDKLRKDSKQAIIRYIVDTLNVPKENILVILPPVNLTDPRDYTMKDAIKVHKKYRAKYLKLDDSEGLDPGTTYENKKKEWLKGVRQKTNFSKRRGDGINRAAREFFVSLGVNVHPQIASNRKEDFPDGYHVGYNTELATNSSLNILHGAEVAAPDTAVDPDPDVAAVEDNNQRLENLEGALERARVELNKAGNTRGRQAQLTKQIKDYEQAISDITKAPDPIGSGEPLPDYAGPAQDQPIPEFKAKKAEVKKAMKAVQAARTKPGISDDGILTKRLDGPGGELIDMEADRMATAGALETANEGERVGTFGDKGYVSRGRTKTAAANAKRDADILKKYRSSEEHGSKAYNAGLNDVLGPIAWYQEGNKKKQATEWVKRNIVRVPAPVYNLITGRAEIKVHKDVAAPLISAIRESQAKYGLPLTHSGAHYNKGKSSRFSSHAWGAAIDLDSFINTFSNNGMISAQTVRNFVKNKSTNSRIDYSIYYDFKPEARWIDQGGKGMDLVRYTVRGHGTMTPAGYNWKFRNHGEAGKPAKPRITKKYNIEHPVLIEQGDTYYDYMLKCSKARKEAMSLYNFVAGPTGDNGIANIFAKYGFFSGMMYSSVSTTAKKDTMHFEFLPYQNDVIARRGRQEDDPAIAAAGSGPQVAAAEPPAGGAPISPGAPGGPMFEGMPGDMPDISESKDLARLFKVMEEINDELV